MRSPNQHRLPARVTAAGDTHTGFVRKQNEDAFVCDTSNGIFIVADGMGGHPAGEVASRMTVDCVHSVLLGAIRAGNSLGESAVRHAFTTANNQVMEESMTNAARFGMGTTVVALVFDFSPPGSWDPIAYVGHVGDSRCYLSRYGITRSMTVDHATSMGYIIQAIGLSSVVSGSFLMNDTKRNDVYLLCSDGITNAVSEVSIMMRLRSGDPVETISKNLIAEALHNGGPDNATAIVVRVD